jgi:hypothetical protein
VGYCSSVPEGEEAWLDGGTVKVFALVGGHSAIWDTSWKEKQEAVQLMVEGGLEGNLLLIKLHAGK